VVLVRRYVSIQVLLALMPAVFSAPFLHLHGHEYTDHFLEEHARQAPAAHPHLSTSGHAHSPSAAISTHEDEDAVSLDWFQAGPQPVPNLEFVLVETMVIPVPELARFWTEAPTYRSHDPPPIVSFSPRAPPATRFSAVGV
jgi:hypothetical protein